MQQPVGPDKTKFANNLKCILKMFIGDLNQTLGIPDEPYQTQNAQAQQQVQSQPNTSLSKVLDGLNEKNGINPEL